METGMKRLAGVCCCLVLTLGIGCGVYDSSAPQTARKVSALNSCQHSECVEGVKLDSSCSECATLICNMDPYCCSTAWDGICVNEAVAYCTVCGTQECAHSECETGPKLDSACSDCAGVVCQADPYCCQSYWDSICVGEATSMCDLCGAQCDHSEYETGSALSPECGPCAEIVCQVDPYCCATYWDSICVNEANQMCAICGNGIVDEDEECDDGNLDSGDGCSADCMLEPWASYAGGQYYDRPNGIVALSDGGAIVAGTFEHQATFGAGEAGETILTAVDDGISFYQDIFLSRYNSDGSLAWTRADGDMKADIPYDVAVDESGIFVAGSFWESVTFGSGEPTETHLTTEQYDAFLARYDMDGNFLWVVTTSGAGGCLGRSLSLLPDGSVIVAGGFYGQVTFGPGQPGQVILNSTGGTRMDPYIARYTAEGSLLWATQGAGSNREYVYDSAGLSDGSVVVVGTTDSYSLTFGAGEPGETTLQRIDDFDTFIIWLNPDGTLAFAKRLGGSLARAVSALADGSSLVTGLYHDGDVFGEGESNQTVLYTSNVYGHQPYLAKYNPDGSLAWARALDLPGDQSVAYDLASNPDGGCAVVGYSYFDGPKAMVSRYSPDGSLQSVDVVDPDSGNNSSANAVDIFPNGSALVAGNYTGSPTFFNQEILPALGLTNVFVARWNPAN